jgi:hypothetical protein
MKVLTDSEIVALLREAKRLPPNWRGKLKPRPKEQAQHGERSLEVSRPNGGRFRIIVRQNHLNVFDFSMILVFCAADGKEYRLRRFNGKHPSGHTNRYEKKFGGQPVYFRNVFHIHTATERYQSANLEIDGFAEPTALYVDLKSAQEAFIAEHNFAEDVLGSSDPGLFDAGTFE